VTTQSLDQTVTAFETSTGRLSSIFAAFRPRFSRESAGSVDDGLGAMRGLAFVLLAEYVIVVIGLSFFGWIIWLALR